MNRQAKEVRHIVYLPTPEKEDPKGFYKRQELAHYNKEPYSEHGNDTEYMTNKDMTLRTWI